MYIYIYIHTYIHTHIYIYIYIYGWGRSFIPTGEVGGIGWKPRRICVAQANLSRASIYRYMCEKQGYGFIEFEISNSTPFRLIRSGIHNPRPFFQEHNTIMLGTLKHRRTQPCSAAAETTTVARTRAMRTGKRNVKSIPPTLLAVSVYHHINTHIHHCLYTFCHTYCLCHCCYSSCSHVADTACIIHAMMILLLVIGFACSPLRPYARAVSKIRGGILALQQNMISLNTWLFLRGVLNHGCRRDDACNAAAGRKFDT